MYSYFFKYRSVIELVFVPLFNDCCFKGIIFLLLEWRQTAWTDAGCSNGSLKSRAAREPHAGEPSGSSGLSASMEGAQ